MMNDEKIMTLHPAGKNGVNISKAKYDFIRAAMIDLVNQGDLAAMEIGRTLADRHQHEFDGSIMWYSTVVKQDLEARGILKKRGGSKPPKWYVDSAELATQG